MYEEFQQCSAEVLAVSTDSVLAHKVFHEQSPHAKKVTYPLLSDRAGDAAKSYDIYSQQQGTSYRATLLIDPGGAIRYYAVYPDEVGREIREVLRILQGLQLYDQTKQLEPAGWRPGMPGMIGNIQQAGDI